jgi:hypothetical protein
MDIETSLSTETTHTVTVTAPDGVPFRMESDNIIIAFTEMAVKFHLDGSSRLATVGTSFHAVGRQVREDGTITGISRLVQGTNLRRLPLLVALAAQEELRESVGTIDDPNGQFIS